MSGNNQAGLFLGAGASYELGMPLVSHLTAEFKGYFTPEHLQKLNKGWIKQGSGYGKEFLGEITTLLNNENMNYEDILGNLQNQFFRSREKDDSHRSIYLKFLEIVYALLFYRQTRNAFFILQYMPAYSGLANLAKKYKPLWVFSTNHDLMVEIISAHCNVDVKDGFWASEKISIRHRKKNSQWVSLKADVLSEDKLNSHNLNFFKQGDSGINLLKLHGALNVFAFRDGMDLCRLSPASQDVYGWIKPLKSIYEDIWINNSPRAVNEIIFYDENNVIQFLRNSLLAGSYKFDDRHHQTLPKRMIRIFEEKINHLESLFIVGYSFGDAHIDRIIRNWLEQDSNKSITIVDPNRDSPPSHFQHLSPQISLIRSRAWEFFASFLDEPDITPLLSLTRP